MVRKMRIAIPCDNNKGLESEVSMHFGRSPYYAFVDIENDEVKNVKIVPLPFADHGIGDLPNFVKQNGGEIVIAYGMGGRAADFFNQLGIKVLIGVQGKVREVIDAFLEDRLRMDKDWKKGEEFGHHESPN